MDVKKVSKALAGALVAILIGLLAKWGVMLTPEVTDALAVLAEFFATAALGFILVYFAPKNQA